MNIENIDDLITRIQHFKCQKDDQSLKFISTKTKGDQNEQRLYCELCVENGKEFIHVNKLYSIYQCEKKSIFDPVTCKNKLQDIEKQIIKELEQFFNLLDEFNEWHFLLTNHNKNIENLTRERLNDLSIKLSNLDSTKENLKLKLLGKYDQLAMKLQDFIHIINQQKLNITQIRNQQKYNSEKVNHILQYDNKLITANLNNEIIIWEQDIQQKHYFITKTIENKKQIQQIAKYPDGIIVCFPGDAMMYNLKQYFLDIKNQLKDPDITQTKIVQAISPQTSLVIHKNDILLTGGEMLKVFKKDENKWKLSQKIDESNIKYLAQNDNLDLVASTGLVLNLWKFDDAFKLNSFQQLQKSNCQILRVQFHGDWLISSDANYQVLVYQMQNSYYQITQKLENVNHGLNLSIGQYLCFGNQVFKFDDKLKQWVIHKILVSFGKELCALENIENRQNLIIGCSDCLLVFEL